MGRHVTKSLYVPGDPEGKGIVAIALDPADPVQKRVLDAISRIPSADLRALLGIPDWETLTLLCGEDRKKSLVLRERLVRIAETTPERLEDAAHQVIRAMPSGVEDSPARVKRHLSELAAPNVDGEWRVLDPFAGTCNFPLAAVEGRPGARAFYCESDTISRLWSRLKIDIASRSRDARRQLDAQLDELALRVPPLVARAAKKDLDSSSPRMAAMAAALDALTGGRRGRASDTRLRDAVEPLRATFLAARMIADELCDESAILGRCFELASAAAAGRAARSAERAERASRSDGRGSTLRPSRPPKADFGFTEHLADALED